MQEDVVRDGDFVVLNRAVHPAQHIRFAGEEREAGSALVPPGVLLGPREIAASAAAGQDCVAVRPRLRLAILTSGDEVRESGSDLSEGEIWDVNAPMLQAALTSPATEIVDIVHVADNPGAVLRAIAALVPRVDLLVTCGGVSVGEEDHMKQVIHALGGETLFSGVALKPGKPVTLGRVGNCHWLGLPGNPLSAFVTWQLFGKPLLQVLSGVARSAVPRRMVVLNEAVSHKAGRCEIRPARLCGPDMQGRDRVICEPGLNSARIASLHATDGLLFLPSEVDHLPQGSLVEFQPFYD